MAHDHRTLSLFSSDEQGTEKIGPDAVLLRGFACAETDPLMADLDGVLEVSPLRHMVTRGGFRMSVAMSNCGAHGWISDRSGYRYSAIDPATGAPWPPIPSSFQRLAVRAAAAAGFTGYLPDACLVNRYAPGTRLSLHQDRNERDLEAPIVSVSLGLPAVFLFGGFSRGERPSRIALAHGDVVVWGGKSRLRYHGVLPIAEGIHPSTGEARINLTFRKAG